ncbi:unnamed protein product [Mytilus edulis]|uniref:Tyr recombinase domain-containing protein n=1 Tax=Mytilus edulis TaxID=6550 RepID=A0A8S3V3R3_MYTED|nr:unnamed protein product [Mytilus edulis]
MSKQVLKQLYIENSIEGVTPLETQQTETVSDEINTDSSPESTVPITLAESVHQHRSSVSNGQNENGGTDRNIAQCFAGPQETFKQLINRDNTHDTSRNREFNLQQWYNHAGIGNRSETSNKGNNKILQGNTENASFISGTQIRNFSCGVHSDEYSYVDIISELMRKLTWFAYRQIPQTRSQCSTTSNEVPKQLGCNVVLNQAVNELRNSHIANTTRTVYDTGFRKFETFMLLNGFQFSSLPPISEDILIYFIAHCFKILSLQYSTIKLYLCGIRIYTNKERFSPTNQTDPLFITIDKKPLERQYFITCIKKVLDICGFNSSHYNGHSFRIGAATSAGKAKIEDHLIKTLGRWTSDSYIRYIRVTPASIKTAQSRLGRI